MTEKDLYRSLSELDDAVLERSETVRRRPALLRWGAFAACAALILTTGLLTFSHLRTPDTVQVYFGGMTREYRKDALVSSTSSAIVWPWEYRTIEEQYTAVSFNGISYRTRASVISPSLLGEVIGSGEAKGYDIYEETEHKMDTEIRAIAGIDPEVLLAARLDGQYYVFMPEEYDPPATLGAFLDACRLTDTLEFKHFSRLDEQPNADYFTLSDYGPVFELLEGCRTAPYVEEGFFLHRNDNTLIFSVCSEALGIENKEFHISADGYLGTNIMEWGYAFYIGEEAAAGIISHVTEHAVPTEHAPSVQWLSGTVAEIGDGYILVDDSILCPNPADGMVFKVITTDPKISRHFDFWPAASGKQVGDLVVVEFTGTVEDGNLIRGAHSVASAFLSESGEVLVPA
ncbi:MAG: hypothetical protein E7463_07470 [Ruminococcaceae bacterium]|nr:hypothetical protein [Oscillospiraceae bacterium]